MEEQYIGLDISQDVAYVCVVDREGKSLWQGKCDSTPESMAATIRDKAPNAVRIGLETGPLSTWHWHGLNDLGLPVICIDAYHTHGVLGMQMNKTDKNDAQGIARIMQAGWYKSVTVKSLKTHEIRALYKARAGLVGMRTETANHIRGILKTFGIIIKGSAGVSFEKRVQEIVGEGGPLADPLRALLDVFRAIKKQIAELDEKVLDHAWACPKTRLVMSILGVGPLTAANFVLAVDDAARFGKSKNVAAYFGLTPKRYQSGEVDFNGRISKRGDTLVRHHLYEAAGVLMTRTRKESALRAWGLRIAKRSGMKKARVAVARKLAVIMHQMLLTGEEFCPVPVITAQQGRAA
jgi:transposase